MATVTLDVTPASASILVGESVTMHVHGVLSGMAPAEVGSWLAWYVDWDDGNGFVRYGWTEDAFYNSHDFDLTMDVPYTGTAAGTYTVSWQLAGAPWALVATDSIAITVLTDPMPTDTTSPKNPQARRVTVRELPYTVTSELGGQEVFD